MRIRIAPGHLSCCFLVSAIGLEGEAHVAEFGHAPW